MRPSKVATIYARDEQGKIIARAKVNNLSSTHVEGVKRALLEQVTDMYLRRQINPKEVDIDDSEVAEARKNESKKAAKLADAEDDEAWATALRSRVAENYLAHRSCPSLSRSFDYKPRLAQPVAPELSASMVPEPSLMHRAIRRLFRGARRRAA